VAIPKKDRLKAIGTPIRENGGGDLSRHAVAWRVSRDVTSRQSATAVMTCDAKAPLRP